jgi:predicted DsbA family dithiol-disulfide isomerase
MIRHDVSGLARRHDAAALATLRIDMIADLICPWCYLGKRRLDKALAAVRGPSVVSWNPFQLNPDMPLEGMGLDEYLGKKFLNPDAAQAVLEQLTSAGAAEGVQFRFDRLTRVPNTLDAHRLMIYAVSQGVDTPDIAESIMKGFFESGLDISGREVLIGIGNENGLQRQGIVRMLDDDSTRTQVLAQEARVRRGGVSGVPNFLINERLFVVGAQPADALVDAFDRAMFGAQSDQPVSDSVH